MTGLLNNVRLRPALALESLQFQNGKFFAELTAVFAKVVKLKAVQIPDSGVYEQVAAVIQAHTNFRVTLVNSDAGPSISFPMIDKNHPLWPMFLRGVVHNSDGKQLLAKAGGEINGSVNLKTGRVSGIWTQLTATLSWPASLLAAEIFLPEEMAAITLHEVGHYFVYAEYITRSVTTNYALAGMARLLDGSRGPDEREAVIVSATRALKLKSVDSKVLAQSGNQKVIETVVMTGVAREIRSELGSQYYDDRGFEYLADQYAARQGAARYNAQALDKLYKLENHRSYLSGVGFVWYEVLKFMLAINPLFTVVMIFAGWSELTASAMHEPPEARFQRMRNQLVEQLKSRQLTDATYQRVMDDLVALDQIMHQVHDRRTLFQTIVMALTGNGQWEQMRLQQELEKLAANDLFVKAQELSRLA